jgi:hypothetical protein
VILATFDVWLMFTVTEALSGVPSINWQAFNLTVLIAALPSPSSSLISIAVARLRAASFSRRALRSYAR